MEQEDLYEILGIARDASEQQVRAACRRVLTQVHPDHGGSDALFRVAYRAYTVLADPERRAAYDAGLRTGDPPAQPEQAAAEADGDDLEAWEPPEPRVPCDERHPRLSPIIGSRPTTSVAHHPSLSVLGGAFVVLAVASVAHVHGLVSFGLAIGGIALIGEAGHRRALRAELARRARIGDVDVMSDHEFERHLVTVFRRDGFAVRRVGKGGDGAETILKTDDVTTVVLAKQRASPLDTDVIQEAAAARARYGTDKALVVTNSVFTSEAADLAVHEQVALMGREELTVLMAGQAGTPPPGGSELLRRELQHGIPAVLELASVLLVGVIALIEGVGDAWEAGTAPADEIAPMRYEETPAREDKAAS